MEDLLLSVKEMPSSFDSLMRWEIDPQRPQTNLLQAAADLVRRGGVIVYPTETFYALGGDPKNIEAVKRVFRIKKRSFDKALPLIAARAADVRRAVTEWSAVAQKLAEAFWPGPLTLILPASEEFPLILHGGQKKIAVRISSHPTAQGLAEESGGLLISTSANITGSPAAADPQAIDSQLLSQIDGIVCGGISKEVLPSTIVDVTVWPPNLIRPGCLAWDEIGRIIF